MDPASLDIIAPMIVAIILFITIGGVILLKPIANNLGQLLQAMAKEREEPRIGDDILRIRELLGGGGRRRGLGGKGGTGWAPPFFGLGLHRTMTPPTPEGPPVQGLRSLPPRPSPSRTHLRWGTTS